MVSTFTLRSRDRLDLHIYIYIYSLGNRENLADSCRRNFFRLCWLLCSLQWQPGIFARENSFGPLLSLDFLTYTCNLQSRDHRPFVSLAVGVSVKENIHILKLKWGINIFLRYQTKYTVSARIFEEWSIDHLSRATIAWLSSLRFL